VIILACTCLVAYWLYVCIYEHVYFNCYMRH